MKKPYTITALLQNSTPPTPIPSKTDLQTHQRTHAAGIPQFTLTENRIIALSLRQAQQTLQNHQYTTDDHEI